MRASSTPFFFILFFGAAALSVTRFTYEDYDCAETLAHFTSFDMSIERPLQDIFEKDAFDILPVGSTRIEQPRLTHFYTLIKMELHRSDKLSPQLSKWIHMEQVLEEDVRDRYISPGPAVDIIRGTLQALVVTAVANDLIPHVQDQETQYKLVFASLIFSQRVDPTKWKVKLRFVLDPNSRSFIDTMKGLSHYRLYYFLQKGPWTGRSEVLYHELSSLRDRAAHALKKILVDPRLRPYVEQMVGS